MQGWYKVKNSKFSYLYIVNAISTPNCYACTAGISNLYRPAFLKLEYLQKKINYNYFFIHKDAVEEYIYLGEEGLLPNNFNDSKLLKLFQNPRNAIKMAIGISLFHYGDNVDKINNARGLNSFIDVIDKIGAINAITEVERYFGVHTEDFSVNWTINRFIGEIFKLL